MAGIGSKLSSKNDFLDNTSLSSLPQSPQAASTAIRECSKAGLEGFLKTQNLSGVLKELFPTLDTSDAFSSLLNSIRTKHENDKTEEITKLVVDEHKTLDSNTMNYSKDFGGTFDSGEDHSSLGILSLDSFQDVSGSLIKLENMAKVSSSDVTASSSDTKLYSLTTITNDTHKGVSSNNRGGIGVDQDRINHEKQTTPVSNSVCTETQESSELENEGSLENIELDNVDLQSLDAKFSDFTELEEEDVFKTKDAEYQHQEEQIPRESKLVSSKNLEITRWLEMQQKMDSTNSNNSTNKTAEMLIERRKINSNESEQETEDNVKNGSGFSGSAHKMETAVLYTSNSGLSEKSERKKAAHDFFPKNDCEVLVNDAGANGSSKNSTCRTSITSCVQQNLPEQVDCHSSIGQEDSKTLRHSDIKNNSLLKDYESLQLYKSALANNQASGLLYSQLFIPAKPLIATEDESNIKNSTSLGISPLEMDASSFTVEEIYRNLNLKSSSVKDKNETKSSEVEFRTDQISARSSSFGSYQTHKIDGSNAESSSAGTLSNLKSQDMQLDSRISKSNFQQQQTNKYFEINPANCNSVKDFDVGNIFLARSSFGDFGSSSTPSNVKTEPASKLQTEDSEKRVNSFPSEDECAELLTTDINVQDASVNHFSCTDMDISKKQQEQLGDLGISDEVFLKPDEALNLLNKDEEDFKKEHIFEGETIPDTYAISLMNSNLTLAALHDVSRPSWYSEVDSGKSSSRVSIGQFIGAKTEELGYLNGSELGVRPEFGINKKKVDSTTDQLTISENKGSSAELAWNSVISKGIFHGSSEDSALGRTSSCTVLSDSTQDSSDSTMFSCSSISKLLSDASLSEDPFVFASKVLEKSKARAVTKKKVKDRNKTPNNGLPTIREDTPDGEHKKTLNEPSSKGVYNRLPEVLSLNTYSENEIKQHRFSLQKAINKMQNIESTFQKKHEDKSDDSLLNKICKFGVEHDLTLKGNINSHLFTPEIMKDQMKDLKEWQKFKRQKESTLSTTSDKNSGEDSQTLKPNSFVNEVLGNTKDTSTSDVTVVTTDAIITRYKATDENSITSVSTTISSNTNTSTCYGQQVLSSFDNTVRLPLPTALQLPIVQLVDSNKVNNSTNAQSVTQLSQGTSINPPTVPVSINVHCKVDPQQSFYPSSYTTNYPLPGLQTLGVPTNFHPSVPPTIENWSKFHQGVDLNTPFGRTVGTPFFPGSTQSVMISPYSTVPSFIYQASKQQCSVVQAPGEINYPGIVCVGDTAPIKIPLHNPTQYNVLYAFKTESVTVDGLTVNDFHGSFLSLPQHVEFECGMTREIEINYTPRQPGTLCAKIMVSASVHFREMTAASSFHSFGCPLYINITVKSEKPRIDLFFGDVGNVRHVPENCSLGKSLVIKNQGLSFIPIRLIISGDMKSKHDFCFDVQNLETKEKSTQLVSPTILLCRLPCASELVVPLVFNAGFLDDGNLVENISASVTAMLESTVIPEVLGYLKWSAVIGKVRLITKTPSEGHIPAKCSGARIKHSLPLYNKGTIPVELDLRVKDNSAFHVSPVKCYLEPEDDTTLMITFEPSFSRGPVTGMIQAIAQPFGQVFDIYKILGNGLVQDFGNQVIKIPPATGISKRSSSAQMNSDNQGFPLQSNKKFLVWPGVPIGTSVIKQMTLRNGSSADSLYLCMNIKGDSQQFQLEGEEVGDHTSDEIAISPGGIHIVKVKYTPKAVEAAFSCLSIHLKGQNHEGQGKFNIPLQGYGGTNKLELEGLQPDEGGDSFSLNVGELAESDATLAHFVVTNTGTRAAYIKIMNFTGPSLESILPAGRITVQPSEFVLLEQESKTLFIACTLSDFKWKMPVNQKNQRLGTLSIFYGDEILRQMMRRAIGTVNVAKILPPGNPLRSVNFDVLYAGEDRVSQTINYPSTSRNVYIFYNNINKVSVNLYGILTGDSSFYGSMSSFAVLTALYDTVNSTVTDSIYHQTQQHANILQSPPVKETHSFAQKLQYLNQEGNKRPTKPLLEHPKEIKLFETVVNTSSSYSFELKSQCNKKVKWRLCPVAVPVIEDLSGDETVNQVQPLPSSVFCVTPDSGEIEPYQFVSVKLVFNPVETGLYKQLWEIIMESMDQARQSEHLKMEGKGIDNPQSTVVHNKLTSHCSLYIPKSNHMDISSHDAYLSKPSNRSASAGDSVEENSRQPVFPVTREINFPVTQIGGSATVKLMLKNVSTENHKLSVVIPIPPFLVKHNELTIKNRHYISLPVQFKPTKQGKYQSVLVLHTDMGYDISVQISGEAS